MKKLIIIGCSLCVLFLLVAIIYVFDTIEKENKPYFSNKEQFMGVFYSNYEVFEKMAITADKMEDGVNFQYNSNYESEQVTSKFGSGDFSDLVWVAVQYCGMTNFQKVDGSFLVYQYAPIIGSDMYIGAKYSYHTSEWEYYYYHDYAACKHVHKLIYRFYDFLFNKVGKL